MGEAWPTIGLGLYVLAGAAVAWWLLADWVRQRARPRRRCPRCWFDMRATEGLRCPDCGRSAESERALWNARRRTGWLALAGGCLIVGYGVRVWPAVEVRGWPAAVPTTMAIWILSPTEGLPWPSPNEDAGWWRQTIAGPLFEELVDERLESDHLSQDQHGWLARRCIRGDAARRPLSWKWRATYGELLHTIARHDDDQESKWRADARELVELRFGAAAGGRAPASSPPFEFDVSETVVLSIHIDDWGGASRWDRRYRIIGRPATPGLEPFDIVRGYDLIANAELDQAGRFNVELGRADQPVEHVVYEIEIHEASDDGGEIGVGALCRRYVARLPIRIVGR